MRGIVKIVALLVVALMAAGLLVSFIGRARYKAALAECHNHLMSIGLSLQNYAEAYGHFPSATVRNPSLPPEKRL